MLSLADEGERFDWCWINARRTADLTDQETARLAPKAWRDWIKEGDLSLPRVDFIAQLTIGEGSSRTPLVVLGQAKCVSPGSPTNARDLARTVARLRRGWLGAFVTTGVITQRAQQEVFEDRYPLVMISGSQVAQAVLAMLHETGTKDLSSLLNGFDREYELTKRVSDPEQLVD